MKNRTTIANVLGVTALVLVVAILSGLVGFLVREKHPELSPGANAAEAAETSFIVTPKEDEIMTLASSPSALSGGSGDFEASYVITAEVMPENASNKKVDWAVSWVNANDSWAKGKSVEDYVTVTPSTDGSVQATVGCYQPFGAQIKVTCTSRSNPSVHGECLCDYVKRVTSVRVLINESYFSEFYLYPGCTISPEKPQSLSSNTYSFERIDYITAYTVDNELTFDIENSYAVFAEEFITAFQSKTSYRLSEAKFELYSKYYAGNMNAFAGDKGDSLFGGLLWSLGIYRDNSLSIFSTAASFIRSNPSLYCYEFHFAFKGSVKNQDFIFKVKQDPDTLYS